MSNEEEKPQTFDEGAAFSPPPTVAPMPENLPATPEPKPAHEPKQNQFMDVYKKPLIIALIFLGVVAGTLLATSSMRNNKPSSTAPTPTPTMTITPTPMRHMAPAATSSAFLKFETSLATLSSTLQMIQITDSTLTPPSVELPLGFPNQ